MHYNLFVYLLSCVAFLSLAGWLGLLACNNLQPAPAPMINASKRSLTPHHDWWQIGTFNCFETAAFSPVDVLWFSLNFQEIIEQQSLRNPLIDVRLKRGWLLRESKKKSLSLSSSTCFRTLARIAFRSKPAWLHKFYQPTAMSVIILKSFHFSFVSHSSCVESHGLLCDV